MKKQINFKRKFGPNAPMPHPKFKKRYFEIRPKAPRQVSLKRKRNGRRRRRVGLCVRRKRKFRLPKLVRAVACGAWARGLSLIRALKK